MVTNATSYGRSGLTDWIIQRVSAVILGVYFLVIIGFFIANPDVDYAQWHGFMASMRMKVFTVLTIAAIAAHAWIGIWGVTTDYINSPSQTGMRLVVQSVVGIATLAFSIWALLVIWGA